MTKKKEWIIMMVFLYFILTIIGLAGPIGLNTSRSSTWTRQPDQIAPGLPNGESLPLKRSIVRETGSQLYFAWHGNNSEKAKPGSGIVKANGIRGALDVKAPRNVGCDAIMERTNFLNKRHYALLYNRKLDISQSIPELVINGVGLQTQEGLHVTRKDSVAHLDKFYAIAERKVQYVVRFSADAQAVFQSSKGDFKAYVDVQNRKMFIATDPVRSVPVNFLQANRDYLVEVYHIYQQAKLRIVDIKTGASAEVTAIHNGRGGVGKGALGPGFDVGMQWDHYCFGLTNGASMLVKRISVYALKKKVKLLMYGDSITQPEGYFPTKDFSLAWTQQVISKLRGDGMSSGRGGAQIDMLLEYIKNELPYIKTKYVMITIGTNGGNTETKLKQLVDYIISQGAIPILNNIPSNESGTQITENILIGKVRSDYGLKGCRFDIATSLAGDGKEVDKTLMYWEDYTGSYGWQIYHHPNKKGGAKMFERTLIDIPELYIGNNK